MFQVGALPPVSSTVHPPTSRRLNRLGWYLHLAVHVQDSVVFFVRQNCPSWSKSKRQGPGQLLNKFHRSIEFRLSLLRTNFFALFLASVSDTAGQPSFQMYLKTPI